MLYYENRRTNVPFQKRLIIFEIKWFKENYLTCNINLKYKLAAMAQCETLKSSRFEADKKRKTTVSYTHEDISMQYLILIKSDFNHSLELAKCPLLI